MQPKMAARRDVLKLDKTVWEWLENWPPVIEPKPSNEPGATFEESELGWKHYMLENPKLVPAECLENDRTWSYACFWRALYDGVMNGQIEVAPNQDHTYGQPFGENFARCQGFCKSTPAPMEWRVAQYGEKYPERYR
jgi:hypothetical protein